MKVLTSLKHVKRHGEGQSVSVDRANHERAWFQTIHDFQPQNIYNMDETNLFDAMPPSKGLSSRTNANGLKISKIKLTDELVCNVDDSERLVPFVIEKEITMLLWQEDWERT